MATVERASLKIQLLRDTLPLILVSAVLVLVVDCIAVAHIREHSAIGKGPDRLNVSFTRELLDVLPFLILPHLLILAALHFWLHRLVDRRVFLPLLNLTTRFINLKNGRPLPMQDVAEIPKELEPLYDAYNRYAEKLASPEHRIHGQSANLNSADTNLIADQPDNLSSNTKGNGLPI